MELQTFKQQCGDLEQRVTTFIQEKEQFEKEVKLCFVFVFFSQCSKITEVIAAFAFVFFKCIDNV